MEFDKKTNYFVYENSITQMKIIRRINLTSLNLSGTLQVRTKSNIKIIIVRNYWSE